MTFLGRFFTLCICLLLALQLPLAALALDVDNSYGDVIIGDTQVTHTTATSDGAITEDHGGSVTVVHGDGSQNGTVTVTAGSEDAPADVNVTISTGTNTTVVLQDANIATSVGEAMSITGAGNVVVELDGANTLVSGSGAGLQTSADGGSLTIQDENSVSGSLTAIGGFYGAGIGGSYEDEQPGDASNITITGGTIYAKGRDRSAGIGGSGIMSPDDGGDASNITITGDAQVTAIGDYHEAAGIGGGLNGTGSNITISGNAQVTAIGGAYAADIGDGRQWGSYEKPENNVDTSLLTPKGSVNGVPGTFVPIFVLNKIYTQTEKDGVMTLTVKDEDAVLTIDAWGMKRLIAKGIHTIVLVTNKAETTLDLNELIQNPGVYMLKHKGEETTLTRNGETVK